MSALTEPTAPPALLGQLIDQAGGFLPLRDWMDAALYHPEAGYYTRHVRRPGRRGDFSTSATLEPALAPAIARWLAQQAPPFPRRFFVMEIGAGDGTLCAEVHRALPWSLRGRTQWFLVEISSALRQLQQQNAPPGSLWFEHPKEALAACHGRACLFANELIDAFPATFIERTATGWKEWGLISSSNQIATATRPLHHEHEAILRSISSVFDPPPPLHHRVEVHHSFQQWLAEWLPVWKQGAGLWIDYGDIHPRLWHRRPLGTLRGYFFHQRTEGIEVFSHFGRQDLTCDVNFSDLQRWLPNPSPLITQNTFIRCQGLQPQLGPAGEAFLVLQTYPA